MTDKPTDDQPETEKFILYAAETPRDPLSPPQLKKLKSLSDVCKVRFTIQKPCDLVMGPVTIDGCKVLRQWEEDGKVYVEFSWPEGTDPAAIWAMFGE